MSIWSVPAMPFDPPSGSTPQVSDLPRIGVLMVKSQIRSRDCEPLDHLNP